MSDFEDRSGIVSCTTDWGRWYQTVEDVTIEVNVEPGTRGREIKVDISTSRISCAIRGTTLFKGVLFGKVIEDESTWTIEDRSLLRILLIKSRKDEHWRSLLENQYAPDPFTMQQMRQKIDLERYQMDNPGFDFSGAKLDKQYEDELPESYVESLDHLGAAALPSLSIGENKTDDEKLLESQTVVVTDDMQIEPTADSAGSVRTDDMKGDTADDTSDHDRGQVVTDDMKGEPTESALVVDHVITDDMKTEPSSSMQTVEPVVTDDMKNEQNESLETDEEKSGQ